MYIYMCVCVCIYIYKNVLRMSISTHEGNPFERENYSKFLVSKRCSHLNLKL